MELTHEESRMLAGDFGKATSKAMEILVALGTIYGAQRLIPASSVQIAGVSFDNLGEAGLEFLAEMASNGGRVRTFTTLNPAGMDIENWQSMGIDPHFAENQERVIRTFAQMGVVTTCSCTPYLFGNLPLYGEHIAWAESSAVCFANSVLGARTNREGGPSALAAALTGKTPEYGLHLSASRCPTLAIRVNTTLQDTRDFGALGISIGKLIESRQTKSIPYIYGIPSATLEQLKSFSASVATYGGLAIFHIAGLTPESYLFKKPEEEFSIDRSNLDEIIDSFNKNTSPEEIDFVSLGCPHLTLNEIQIIAKALQGKRVKKTFWITTSRPIKKLADQSGYTKVIEEAGAIFACDTCCVVSPLKGRFHALATDSAKACYYAGSKNAFKTLFLNFEEVIQEALR